MLTINCGEWPFFKTQARFGAKFTLNSEENIGGRAYMKYGVTIGSSRWESSVTTITDSPMLNISICDFFASMWKLSPRLWAFTMPPNNLPKLS